MNIVVEEVDVVADPTTVVEVDVDDVDVEVVVPDAI
jgi:hypothetical protein